MRGIRTAVGAAVIAGMIVYAVPRIEVGSGDAARDVFALAWLGFALLILAAHLHRLLAVDEEAARELERIRRVRRRMLARRFAAGRPMRDGSAHGVQRAD